MDVLIIGGTRFLGRALTDMLLSGNHKVTHFNRGKSNANLYPDIETIIGDREFSISLLGDRSWDIVIDTCGYIPRIVKQSANYLKDKVQVYVFISSISVYSDSTEVNRDESSPVIELEDPLTEEISGETYGGLKLLCERVIQERYGHRAVIIRPGLIVGPHDPTHRFTYWPVRVKNGGKMIIPPEDFPIQFIDVRDLAQFITNICENKISGLFNVTGPEVPLSFSDFLQICQKQLSPDCQFISVPTHILKELNVSPWTELTMWEASPEGEAMSQISIKQALGKGLTFRPVEETILDTVQWYESINGDEQQWPYGLKKEKEMSVLKKLE